MTLRALLTVVIVSGLVFALHGLGARTLAGDTLGAGALSTSRDVLLVVGRSAGAALALRIGSADTQVTMATVGATQAITVTCTATDSASFGVF